MGFISIDLPLTKRKSEVLKLILADFGNKDITEVLGLSLSTVKTHIEEILQKLSVNDRTQTAVKALRKGII